MNNDKAQESRRVLSFGGYRAVLLKRLVLLAVVFYAVFWIVRVAPFVFDDIVRNVDGRSVLLEGTLTREGPNCSGGGGQAPPVSSVLVDVLHTPTPYALDDRQGSIEKAVWRFEGKRIRVRGVSTKDAWLLCLDGQEQKIPIVQVLDIEPL